MQNELGLPPFRARGPWWGPHLQTLRYRLAPPKVTLLGSQERLLFDMLDDSGDRLSAVLNTPETQTPAPLIVLIHGLTGSENSDYVRVSAAYHLSRGRRVLRMNLRGAGPSRRTCGGQYHVGSYADIEAVLIGLNLDLISNGVFLVGYSLGGNVLMKYLAQDKEKIPIVGAATVSASIDPGRAAKRLMEPRNALYHRYLLSEMKRHATARGAKLSDHERAAILEARTIYELDDTFVAPRNGFRGADDFYNRTAGVRVAADIQVPLLLIHSRNDPWVPSDTYDELQKSAFSNINVILSPGGGHVGFHASDDQDTWHDRAIDAFMKRSLSSSTSTIPEVYI